MKIKVAYVEDDDVIRDNYSDMLREEGFIVEAYSSKDDAINVFRSKLPDLALLDVSLQGERDAGFHICSELRKLSSEIPIIFLTSHDSEIDQISGLRLGADDYITKDVSIDYIVVRIEALIRRMNALRSLDSIPAAETTNRNLANFLNIDNTSLTVTWKEEKLDLPLTQFWILQAICSNPGQIKTHKELMCAAKIVVEPNTISAHIKAIRDKFKTIEPDFDGIKTERGKGYRWVIF